MRRALLVNRVEYGGVALPAGVDVVMTVRRSAGVTDWEASVTVSGRIDVPESGEFNGRTHAGNVAGNAAASVHLTESDSGPRTTITWRGEGAISLPDD